MPGFHQENPGLDPSMGATATGLKRNDDKSESGSVKDEENVLEDPPS